MACSTLGVPTIVEWILLTCSGTAASPMSTLVIFRGRDAVIDPVAGQHAQPLRVPGHQRGQDPAATESTGPDCPNAQCSRSKRRKNACHQRSTSGAVAPVT